MFTWITATLYFGAPVPANTFYQNEWYQIVVRPACLEAEY